MINIPQIETPRLIIRPFTMDDVEARFQLERDREVNIFLPRFPAESLEEVSKKLMKDIADPTDFFRAICLKEDNIPIGYVNVSGGDSRDLGYALRREYWHRGIVTEACRGVIEPLRQSGLQFITATHDRNNPRSGGVMRNIGMKYCYSYESLWQPKNILVVFRMYQLNLDGDETRVYNKYREIYPNNFAEEGL